MSTSVISDSMMYLQEYISDLLDLILETEYSDRVFSGVMKREDFVDYVAFEVCTEQHLQSAKTNSLRCHVQHLKEDHKNYLRDLQCLNQQSKKIKDVESFDENSLYHGLRPYLSDMIDRRSGYVLFFITS